MPLFRNISAFLIGLAALTYPLAESAGRTRSNRDQPTSTPTEARPIDALKTALQPYLSAAPDQSGWRINDLKVDSLDDGGTRISARDVSYVLSASRHILFPTLEIRAEKAKENGIVPVTITLPEEISLRSVDSVLARLSTPRQRVSGEWDAKRDSFASLRIDGSGVVLTLANSTKLTISEMDARITTAATGSAQQTGQMTSTISASGVIATGVDQQWRMTATSGQFHLTLKNLDKAPSLSLNYSHQLQAGRYTGLSAELIPLALQMVLSAERFPWSSVLRLLPDWLAETAAATSPEPVVIWGGLWQRISAVLSESNSEAAFNPIKGRSNGLVINGKGEVKFAPGREPQGLLNADIRGLNERIASLESKDRQGDPLLFPALALMTVIGNGSNEGNTRIHRFKVEMNAGAILVNGRNATGLKPEPKP